MPWLDLPSAIAASTSRSRGLSRSNGLVALTAAEHPPDDLGVKRAAAAGDPGDRVDEALDITHALFEQVADSLGALPDQIERVLLLVVLRKHQHTGLGPLSS